MKIRKAVKSDIREVSRIFKEEQSKEPYNNEINDSEAEKIIRNYFEEQTMYVAVEGKKTMGFVVGDKYNWIRGRTLWISEIFVDSKFQGKGIGRLLMEAIISHFRKDKISSVELLTHLNAPAENFYKKLGFKKTEYVKLEKKMD